MLRLVLGIAVATASSASAGTLEERVEALLKSPGYGGAHWGILVVDGKTGQTVFERNADQLFAPASVTKLYSTAAALADLGADYRFATPIVRRGDVDPQGKLQGDLILVASGDLSLGGRTGPDGHLLFEDNDHTYAGSSPKHKIVRADPLAGLDHLAREVYAAGIKEVIGDVLIDDRLFRPANSTGSGPSRLTPIVVNDNLVDVLVTPGAKPGDPASVRLVPETSFVTADFQVTTAAAEGRPTIEVVPQGSRRFTVRGTIPAGHSEFLAVYEVEEPATFARALLIERLRKREVKVAASPLGSNDANDLPTRSETAKLPKVAEYVSPPLKEYLRVVLKVSHNLHASTLPLLIASHHGERTLASGLRRQGALLKTLGVDPDSISFGGGAGGDRSDLASPRATVALLRAMAARPDFAAYEAALPVLGRDGTLAEAVPADSPARGHVRAKTGTYYVGNGLNTKAVLTSKALAGYLETAKGRTLVFAFYVNNVPLKAAGTEVSDATAAAGKLLGKLCEVFYDDREGSPGNGSAGK